ncbi:hypothetical protein D3C77_433480 [compost metagenome]
MSAVQCELPCPPSTSYQFKRLARCGVATVSDKKFVLTAHLSCNREKVTLRRSKVGFHLKAPSATQVAIQGQYLEAVPTEHDLRIAQVKVACRRIAAENPTAVVQIKVQAAAGGGQ